MKSRVAVTMVLALGLFMSGTGATLAVTGLASSGSASSAQYPEDEPKKESHNTLGTNESGGGGGNKPAATAAAPKTTPVATPVETQAVRQVASSSGDTLPFTGFLAVPVLLVGLGLLGAGVAMRFRVRSGRDAA